MLQALLFADDPHSQSMLSGLLETACIESKVCRSIESASEWLAQRRFDAVLVDCERIAKSVELLNSLRRGRSNASAITFAVVGNAPEGKIAHAAGANFVLQRPLEAERVLRCIRAAHGLIFRERRRYFRHEIDASAHLVLNDHEEVHAHVNNVSEGGMGVRILHKRKSGLTGRVKLRFALPSSDVPIEGTGEIMWSRAGEAGIKFVSLRASSRHELYRWLAEEIQRTSTYLSAASGARALAAR